MTVDVPVEERSEWKVSKGDLDSNGERERNSRRLSAKVSSKILVRGRLDDFHDFSSVLFSSITVPNFCL